MADFFDDLGKKISEVASDLGKRTEDTLEIQKMKSEVRTLKRANERDYRDIGRMMYDKFQKGEITDTSCIELCSAIEKREEEIEARKETIERIKEEM